MGGAGEGGRGGGQGVAEELCNRAVTTIFQP